MGRVFANDPETRVQSLVESYQRLKKWYLIPPCLPLSIIRYVSRVKWSNPEKGVAPSFTPFPLHTYTHTHIYIYMGCTYFFTAVFFLLQSLRIYIYIYIYIHCHCFVVSQLFSVARHVGRLKMRSKPDQFYVTLSIRPLSQQACHVS